MHHQEIIDKICRRHFVTRELVESSRKDRILVAARYEVMHELYINGYEPKHIAKIINMQRTTVYKGIGKYIEKNPDCTWESSFEKHNSCLVQEEKEEVDLEKRLMARRAYDRIVTSSNTVIGSPSGAIYEKGGDKLLWWLVRQTPEGSTIMDTLAAIALDAMHEDEQL